MHGGRRGTLEGRGFGSQGGTNHYSTLDPYKSRTKGRRRWVEIETFQARLLKPARFSGERINS